QLPSVSGEHLTPSRLSRYKKKGFCSAMAFPAPAAVFLDENLPIHRGKRADGLNARPLKPSAKPSARKALRDVSNTSKPQAPSIQKGHPLKDRSVLKDKSALRSQEAIKKNPLSKTTIYADEATKKCHEWAKGGVEGTHFTGNDAQRLDSDKIDKRENLCLIVCFICLFVCGRTFQYVHVTGYIMSVQVSRRKWRK
uniref:Uncharacterized protein n=1 Tax=Aegilops tauschii subsp. strangulata TaxID=200361 RepID=A0A453P1J6_AEGTS